MKKERTKKEIKEAKKKIRQNLEIKLIDGLTKTIEQFDGQDPQLYKKQIRKSAVRLAEKLVNKMQLKEVETPVEIKEVEPSVKPKVVKPVKAKQAK